MNLIKLAPCRQSLSNSFCETARPRLLLKSSAIKKQSSSSSGRACERAIKLQAANGCRIDAVGAHNIDQRFTISEPLDGRLTLTQAADRSLAREAFLPAIIPNAKNIALKTLSSHSDGNGHDNELR